MKKFILLLTAMIGSMATHAESYTYLTFELTDGSKTSVAVSSLTLSISGTTLTAGSQSFTLTNLSKMYFSTADETTGINAITAEELNEITDIYDLQGRKIAKEQMRQGVYIIKTKRGTFKIAVK
ncbi:MAG: hypothetical protein IJV17_04950 [Prevotella sp.]|nr:hypothetical protein [Prevotella sp.]